MKLLMRVLDWLLETPEMRMYRKQHERMLILAKSNEDWGDVKDWYDR